MDLFKTFGGRLSTTEILCLIEASLREEYKELAQENIAKRTFKIFALWLKRSIWRSCTVLLLHTATLQAICLLKYRFGKGRNYTFKYFVLTYTVLPYWDDSLDNDGDFQAWNLNQTFLHFFLYASIILNRFVDCCYLPK